MKSLNEIILENLSKYFRVENALEQGFSNGKYTMILANYAKKVTAIDVSNEFFNVAKTNLREYKNIDLQIMDAEHMNFEDKSFDVLLNTSFHEFDLSNDVYKLDLDMKKRILKEMIRVSNVIVFIEPSENAVTNELFKVFNPNENHSDRIYQSNKLISEFMKENNYKLIETGLTFNEDKFSNMKELEEEMLNWWADIKIPSNEIEKQNMIKKIDKILDDAGMLSNLSVIEEIRFNVYKLEE